jgi:protease I
MVQPTHANLSALIFAGPDFEDRELFVPYYRCLEAGMTVTVAGLGEAVYKGKYGVSIETQGRYEDFLNQDWDLIIIPGGWAPDKIRMNSAALSLVQKAVQRNKPVAAICHAGWVLASAKVVQGKRVTSYKAIKDDLIHAGATWVDEPVVVDGCLITSRTPDDLPAFMVAVMAATAKTPVNA